MSTTDLWFAAYLQLRGYICADFEKLERKRCRFKFDISEGDWKKLKVEFLKSDISKIKQIQGLQY